MRIRFTATERLAVYRGWHDGKRIFFEPGEEKDVPEAKAEQLQRDFPQNFSPGAAIGIIREIDVPPVDRMMRKAKTRRRGG